MVGPLPWILLYCAFHARAGAPSPSSSPPGVAMPQRVAPAAGECSSGAVRMAAIPSAAAAMRGGEAGGAQGAWPEFEAKMRAAGQTDAAIAAFKGNYFKLLRGETGTIAEADIEPVTSLPALTDLPEVTDGSLVGQTVVLKLNGGLGTGMGLQGPKSLLVVREPDVTFLDLIVSQMQRMRKARAEDGGAPPPRFALLNSAATSEATRAYLSTKHALREGSHWHEVMQSVAPKVDADSLRPAVDPSEARAATGPSGVGSQLEWYPPGHGDLYAALAGSGQLDEYIANGYRFLFVSNSDNLGATLDLRILQHFKESGAAFLMEVCERTASDKKGGHLARRPATPGGGEGGLLLREAAQCLPEDEDAFQDVTKHRYFNTNNLWIDLLALRAELDSRGGALDLPLIKNGKTIDPRDKKSAKVWQLETAMGAAIEDFGARAAAVVVPRNRFSPVKTCADLLCLRSDAYAQDASGALTLQAAAPPLVSLDDQYKKVDDFEQLVPQGAPSLIGCSRLKLSGKLALGKGVTFKGAVSVTNPDGSTRKEVPPGEYADTDLAL